MHIPALCASYAVGGFTVPQLTPQESAALIVLGASALVYRTFRERYLLIWIAGWLIYLASRCTMHSAVVNSYPLVNATARVELLLAICLFGISVLLYTHSPKRIPLLVAGSLAVGGFGVASAILWPGHFWLSIGFEIAYRIIGVSAALWLIRARWDRGEAGPWLMLGGMLLLHSTWPLYRLLHPAVGFGSDLLLGLSMLVVVFDDSRVRTRRLGVINALTTSITRAQQHGPMMATALAELKTLMRARAAWFRLVEDGRMVMAQHIGLSPEFLRARASVPLDDKFEETLSDTAPIVVKTATSDNTVQRNLRDEGFEHVVLLPVRGKKSIIGTLTLGSERHIHYTPAEMEFLITTAHQLGLAVENLRLMEQILRSHRQWTNTFDSIQDNVLVHDSEFRIMKANRAVLQRLGKAPADVIGKACEGVLSRAGGDWKSCPYCGGGGFYEGPDPCFGGYSVVSTSSYVDQGSRQKGTIHVVRDITERRMAEEKYRLLFEQMQEGVFVATPGGRLLDCNDAFMRMLGYSTREELMHLNIDTEIYASTQQREVFRREVELHNYVRNFEVTLRRKDGSLLTAMESSFVTRDTEARIERYQGFVLDMTEKKRAEDEIRRRNRELNALNAMAVIATQSFDLDEILNLTLRQVVSLLGADNGSIYLSDAQHPQTFRRRAEWGHKPPSRPRPAEAEIADGFGDLVTRSRTEVITAEYLPHLPSSVIEFIRSDGQSSWIWVLLWGKDRPIGMMGLSSGGSREYSSNDESLLVAIGRQLATTIEKVNLYEETCRAYDDLRRTQEQLLQSEKMSAVGQLIAGVAHELNNPLTAILGYAQLLESESLQDRAADFVRKIFKQAQRTHRVVQNLLSFARQRKPHKHAVDICKVLDETLLLRDYDLRVNGIEVVREIDNAVPAVTADPHQLEQVFLNIINNAADAMLEAHQRGKLLVRVSAVEGRVCVEFKDSGPGIKEPNRIFDPFYTTKIVGKGTGLGLSICYGIVKEHGGDISARNNDGGGASISIRLPSSGWQAPKESSEPASRPEIAIEGRILLVEDEEAVLEFARDVLSGAGADVVALSNGEEVKLRLLKESFDALVMNGKMPGGWNAPEVHQWLSEKCPGMEKHVLFTFAALTEQNIRTFLQEKNVPHLVKPFDVAELISHARKLLQKSHAATAS